jgi:hypothetical protein
MKKLAKPKTSAQDVFRSCASGIDSDATRNRVLSEYSTFAAAELQYELAGMKSNLSSIYADSNLSLALGEDLWKKLYTQYMVPEGKPARRYYDEVLVAANGKCPLCTIGHVASLDHYLPKSQHPIYSVLISNLVPACESCNRLKGSYIAKTPALQTFHPYFEQDHFYEEQWISAKLKNTDPLTVIFFAAPPSNWSAVDQSRAKAHFSEFKLAKKFGIEAASEISVVDDLLRSQAPPLDRDGLVSHLRQVAISVARASNIVNHWKAILYQTLSTDSIFLTRYL